MAAAPYKVVLSIQTSEGKKSVPLTASDVNAAAWVFPSGGTELQLSSGQAVITDIIYTAAGTDTTSVDVFVNGINTGYRIFNGTNLYNVLGRQIQSTPIGIRAGALVKFVQNT